MSALALTLVIVSLLLTFFTGPLIYPAMPEDCAAEQSLRMLSRTHTLASAKESRVSSKVWPCKRGVASGRGNGLDPLYPRCFTDTRPRRFDNFVHE